MRHERILQTLIEKHKENIHQSHVTFLNLAIDSLNQGANLNVTSIARRLNIKITDKHNVKRVNYMLGSKLLYEERPLYYSAMAHSLIGSNTNPFIIVDWSPTIPSEKFHILRASLVVEGKGRAVTIYEENYPESKLGSEKVHKEFIEKLKKILPCNCKPIIITDAGFKVPWFKLIIEMGWDYVGRVRGNTYCRFNFSAEWKDCRNLYDKATARPFYLGKLELTKSNQWKCYSHLLKIKGKGRKKKTVTGKIDKSSASLKHAKREREPWLLVTSLPGKKLCKKIIAFYSTRMQIEETFRDTKSHAYGMGLKTSLSRSTKRFDILLLIGSLAHYVLYLLGRIGENKNMAKDFQSNTIKNRRVLSPVFLGRQLWRKGPLSELLHDVSHILKQITKEAACVYSGL